MSITLFIFPARSTMLHLLGSKLIPSLLRIPHVHELYLSELPKIFKKLPFTLFAPLKVAVQVVTILVALIISIPHPPEYIMVQVRG